MPAFRPTRATTVRTLAYGPIVERAFPDWRMAYVPAMRKCWKK